MNTTETIMNIWAKIVSLGVIAFGIWGLYLTLNSFDNALPFSSKIGFALTFLFATIMGLAYYFPMVYFAWVKKPNKDMKLYAKLVAITYVIMVVLVSPMYNGVDVPTIFIVLLLIVPLFYYGWRKK